MSNWDHTFTADEVNAPDFGLVANAVSTRLRKVTADRERYAEDLLRDKLPRRLHWLIDHPRLLKRVLRVVRRWEPRIAVIQLRQLMHFASPQVARQFAKAWLEQAEEAGAGGIDGGLIFTYTDASGLPAEIYGVR